MFRPMVRAETQSAGRLTGKRKKKSTSGKGKKIGKDDGKKRRT